MTNAPAPRLPGFAQATPWRHASPTHAQRLQWQKNNRSLDWRSLFRYYMVEEMRLPDQLVQRVELAYMEHGGEQNPRGFTQRATTVDGWERFLRVLEAGVPADYLFHFFALYDFSRGPDEWTYGGDDVLEAWRARIPVDFVRASEALAVKETASGILLLVAEGVDVEYASAAVRVGHSAPRVLKAWNAGIPLDYIPAPVLIAL